MDENLFSQVIIIFSPLRAQSHFYLPLRKIPAHAPAFIFIKRNLRLRAFLQGGRQLRLRFFI